MIAPLMDFPDDEPSDDELLTSWERNFLVSIALWEGDLTPAQEDKLAEIEQLLVERREAKRTPLPERGPRGWR
jgi:hypothetical protein